MTNLADTAGRRLLDALQEAVAAEARILFQSIASRHVTDSVAEEPAEIPDLFLEVRSRGVGIALGVEQQRMPALRADIFVTAVAIDELFVVVLAEKARQRVTNAGNRSVFSEVLGTATAMPSLPIRVLEDVIVNVMAPDETRQFG